jgi:hypothetical protein
VRRFLLLVSIFSVALSASAQKKKSGGMPQQVVVAQFAYVTSLHGDVSNSLTTPADRDTINRLESFLRTWGKCRIVYHPSDADIMLVVKPGELGSLRTGISIPSDPTVGGRIDTTRNVAGVSMGGDMSSTADDMLLVSVSPQEPADTASFFWRRSAHNGLQGIKPALFEEFRQAVADAEKAAAKKP